jgi:hypothetical protein
MPIYVVIWNDYDRGPYLIGVWPYAERVSGEEAANKFCSLYNLNRNLVSFYHCFVGSIPDPTPMDSKND